MRILHFAFARKQSSAPKSMIASLQHLVSILGAVIDSSISRAGNVQMTVAFSTTRGKKKKN